MSTIIINPAWPGWPPRPQYVLLHEADETGSPRRHFEPECLDEVSEFGVAQTGAASLASMAPRTAGKTTDCPVEHSSKLSPHRKGLIPTGFQLVVCLHQVSQQVVLDQGPTQGRFHAEIVPVKGLTDGPLEATGAHLALQQTGAEALAQEPRSSWVISAKGSQAGS